MLVWSVALLWACNNDAQNDQNDNALIGKELYYRKCLSCHSMKDHNTLHKPSLNEMAKQNDSFFNRSFMLIKSDTLHPSYLQDTKLDALKQYIRSYKEQKIIPTADSDQKEK